MYWGSELGYFSSSSPTNYFFSSEEMALSTSWMTYGQGKRIQTLISSCITAAHKEKEIISYFNLLLQCFISHNLLVHCFSDFLDCFLELGRAWGFWGNLFQKSQLWEIWRVVNQMHVTWVLNLNASRWNFLSKPSFVLIHPDPLTLASDPKTYLITLPLIHLLYFMEEKTDKWWSELSTMKWWLSAIFSDGEKIQYCGSICRSIRAKIN